MNKKGLASSVLAVIIVLFIFALFSLIGVTGWSMVNDTFQNMSNSTVSPEVKQQIDDISFMGWSDTIFVLFFIALLIGFMVTSFTLSTDQPIYIALYFVFLVFTTIIAMIVSNGWSYLIVNPNFATAVLELPFTTWFMTYLPVVSFFMGLIGGIIFYARKKRSPVIGDLDGGLSGGGDL